MHVFVHGGYWRAQDKENFAFVASELASREITTVVINYELCPSSTLDLVAHSALAAIEWVNRHVAEYGGDPRRISLLGHSAGAHLCAVGLAADWQGRGIDPSFIRGTVLVSGIFDPTPAMNTTVNPGPDLTPEIVARHDVRAARDHRRLSGLHPGGRARALDVDRAVLSLFASSAPARTRPRGARAAGLHAFRHHRSIPGRRKPAAPGGAAHGGPLSRGREVRALVDGAFDRERRTPMGARFFIADRGRRCSSRSRGISDLCCDTNIELEVVGANECFERIAGGHEEETTRKSSRPRAQAGSTHRVVYFRLGGEGARSGTTAMAWNSGPSETHHLGPLSAQLRRPPSRNFPQWDRPADPQPRLDHPASATQTRPSVARPD